MLSNELLDNGYALIPGLLDETACRELRSEFDRSDIFRSHVVMERHNFGRGEYKYYSYPLPERVAGLRERFYRDLAPTANEWNARLGKPQRFPQTQQMFLEMCAQSDQQRPTALILRYRAGDYNCMHEDTYGELAFPFQMTIFLSSRDEYEGGEFVLVEQRPRAQSRPFVLTPDLGDALVFPNKYRPVAGKNGYYRTAFKHGVSELRSGERYALGVIFHDSR